MITPAPVRCLFLDVGGVLLTNGWDRVSRAAAAEKFGLEPVQFEDLHHTVFETYEEGKLNLTEYLDLVVFNEPRNFTSEEFTDFMFSQSQAYPGVIEYFSGLKRTNRLKVFAVNNEARILNIHRIMEFALGEWIDGFISSCFVHLHKPDPDMFHLALDICQVEPGSVVYIDNTAMFTEIATELGIRSIHHQELASTQSQLCEMGLS